MNILKKKKMKLKDLNNVIENSKTVAKIGKIIGLKVLLSTCSGKGVPLLV